MPLFVLSRNKDPRSKLHLGHLLNRSREPFPPLIIFFSPLSFVGRQLSLLHLPQPSILPFEAGASLLASLGVGLLSANKAGIELNRFFFSLGLGGPLFFLRCNLLGPRRSHLDTNYEQP
ncbi:hypothetical protein CI102_11160 [Trichoderma harzianum]|uniref:Uncharacterized protein n=1 Tax=Trichoderma harzianum CBS 226.95 TaxID=983964 RepID=A0A2T4AD46_TRIHA|nr:hypothetical protein M431DRAFT_430624 [Trichoderma harzianum CBS 226.95]PKK43571.1 hypothetical protein CI102_11160 [Trichoderma harzianum]PTB54848.1 hypothetical protein M431DRAFT_430624 [Trichoderma harzianum CBS 226.95]